MLDKDKVIDALKAYHAVLDGANVAGNIFLKRDPMDVEGYQRFIEVIDKSRAWQSDLNAGHIKRTIQPICGTLDELVNIFQDDETFKELKDYTPVHGKKKYGEELINQSKALAEAVHAELDQLNFLEEQSANYWLPKGITVGLLKGKTETLIQTINAQEARLSTLQEHAVTAEPVFTPSADVQEEIPITLEAELEALNRDIEAFTCQVGENSFHSAEEMGAELDIQGELMLNLYANLDKLDEVSKKEAEQHLENIQKEVSDLNSGKRELSALHEKKGNIEKALLIKKKLSTSADKIFDCVTDIEQNVNDIALAQKKANKKEKSDLFSMAYKSFSANIQSLNQAVKTFFNQISIAKNDIENMPERIKIELNDTLDKQVQEVTEKLGQSDATALTEKDALSLISSESREALNTTLAKQPTRQNFEKVQHRAKHAFNKATSKTYADNFKAYKKDLTALKKEAAAVNQEKTVASEEASKGDKIKTTRISPR